jgi:hypothetical protein
MKAIFTSADLVASGKQNGPILSQVSQRIGPLPQ